MTTTTDTTSPTTDREVAELRRAVLALQEELDRRDLEQAELESVVEHLVDRASTSRRVLAQVIGSVFGDCPSEYGGDKMIADLYGPKNENGWRQTPYVIWHRPQRR